MAQAIDYQEATREIPERPRARAGLWRRLWEGLGIQILLEKLGISKYIGLWTKARF